MAEEATKVMVEDATPKKAMFMNRPYSQEERVKRDEEELARLVEEQKGTSETSEEETPSEEEPTNAEEKTFKKRYGDLRRHTQDKEKQFQKQLDDMKEQLAKATKKEMKLPKSDEDIEAWATEYPDVAKIVETIAMKKAKEQSLELESRIQKIDEMSADAQKDKAEAELMRIHPDFNDIRDSDEFHDWAGEQPKWVQDALYENQDDPRSVVRVIDLYKGDKGLDTKSRKKSTKEAASAVVTKRSTKPSQADTEVTFTESQIGKMSMKDFEKHQDAIMEAQRTGKFVYDLSGGAR